jgi:TonB family protein
LSALAPERTSTPLGPVQAPDERHSVATAKSAITDSQTAIHSKAHRKPGTHVRSFPVPSASTEAAPPVSAKSAAAAPGSADSAAAAPLSPTQTPAMSTQLLPAYPSDPNRSVEQGVTQVQVSTSAAGAITDCHVVEPSGSLRLDASACSLVQRNWQGPPLTRSSQRASGAIIVSVIWNLRAAK